MTIRFYLHNQTNADGTALICADYRHAGKRWRFSLGLTVEVKHWNAKKERMKPAWRYAEQVNAVLDAKEAAILSAAYSILAEGREPTPDAVKASFQDEPAGMGLWACWDRFAEEHAAGLAAHSAKNYTTARRALERFEMFFGEEIGFQNLGESFFTRFKTFLSAEGKKQNTVTKILKSVRTVLGYAERNGWASLPPGWDSLKAGYRKGEKRTSLTEEELSALFETDYPEKLRRVVDLFIFQADTGLRYSDLSQVEPGSVAGDVLNFRNVKSSKQQSRRLTARAVLILNRYGGTLPAISNQKFNDYIKEAAERAGLTRIVQTGDGARPLFEIVSTHVARHTFATRLLRAGVPLNIVSRMLGHSSITTTAIYDQTGEAEEFNAIDKLLQ